jgi:hypothetical protein
MSHVSVQQLFTGLALLAVAACGANAQEAGSPSRAAGDEWTVLFDGNSLDAWRGFRRDDLPPAWRLENGTLAFVPGGSGGDIITREKFGDFELQLEWRIAEAGNSGIFYWVNEGYQHVWHSGPEMQVLDDDRHPDGRHAAHRAGANYGLHVPAGPATRPVGEWNQVRIVTRGNHVEHWLNGQKVVEYEAGSPDWLQRVAGSKFADMPGYGRYRRGHIALQDHGDRVWYRNIRIRPLPLAESAAR